MVDEATGYQVVRDRHELHRILEAHLPEELSPWTKLFPDEFFRELFRLREWQYSPVSIKRPKGVGRIIAELIYDKLPGEVIEELGRRSLFAGDDRRARRHRRLFLADVVGHPHLDRQYS